jgi:hypothetical protein
MTNGERNHLLIQECTPAIGNFDSCFAPSYLIGRGLRFVFRNIQPLLCFFDHDSPTLVITSDRFLMRIFRGCCGVSLPKKREEHPVETGIVGLAASDPLGPIFTSYSRSKANQKECSLQPMARREKLNFDRVYPLVNLVRVIPPVFGVHRKLHSLSAIVRKISASTFYHLTRSRTPPATGQCLGPLPYKSPADGQRLPTTRLNPAVPPPPLYICTPPSTHVPSHRTLHTHTSVTTLKTHYLLRPSTSPPRPLSGTHFQPCWTAFHLLSP